MIIVKAAGGLGNQMQQYALYRKFISLGRQAKMDLSWFTEKNEQTGLLMKRNMELERFGGISLEVCTPEERDRMTGGNGIYGKIRRKLSGLAGCSAVFRETDMYHPEILDLEQGYLEGYFACEKYYEDILPELREEFVFPEGSNRECRERNESLRRMMEGDAFSVSVHLRRGDYLDSANAALFGGICTDAYYEGAVRELRRAVRAKTGEDPVFHFYIFSDDPEYMKTVHFGEESEENTVADCNHGENSMLDIRLMSCCRGNICANSTFSFWGARLNRHRDKVMIRPSVHKNTQHPTPSQMHDLWRKWILVDRDGNLF